MKLHGDVLLTAQENPEWVKLIRKLHWIGLEDEAMRLEQAVSTLHPPATPQLQPFEATKRHA
jgi:hypothetical protein